MATATKRGNTYKITQSMGYDITGKQIRLHTTWEVPAGMTPSKEAKELERQKMLWEERCRTGQVLESSTRLADFMDRWFSDYAEEQLRPRTLARYRALAERTKRDLGHIRLDKLKPANLVAFYKKLGEEGERGNVLYKAKVDIAAMLKTNKESRTAFSHRAGISISTVTALLRGQNVYKTTAEQASKALGKSVKELFETVGKTRLANNTILYYHRFVSSVLSTAVQWQVIASNPCERVKPPKPDNRKIYYLDEHQAISMLEMLEAEEIQFRTAVTVLLFTGVRRGELLGLEWDDIDYQRQTIQIERTSQYLPGKGVFTDDTKTEKSQRVIIVPQAALRVLKELQRWQTEQRLALGDKWAHSNRVLITWNGKPMHPDTLSGQFQKFIAKTDLPQITVHGLRHTNATLQIAQGVPLPNVADHLGHDTSVTTAKIYAHAVQSARLAAANMLDNLLTPQTAKTG